MKRYEITEGEKPTVKQVREGQTFTINLPHGGFIKFVMDAKRQARCIGCEPYFYRMR